MTEPTFTVQPNLLRLPTNGITVIFAVWFCLGMLWYIPNNGGSGLALPLNALCWMVIAISLVWMVLTLRREFLLLPSKMFAPSPLWLLPLGAVLWTLPLIWSPCPTARYESLPHVVALWGFLGLFWWLRRLPNQMTRQPWLTLLWIAALLQGVFAFMQVTVLAHYGESFITRPMGIFQQPNVLASFLSTGLACLFASECLDPNAKSQTKGSRVLRAVALIFIPFMLVLVQSRAGWLGALLAVVTISLIDYQTNRTNAVRLRTMWLLMLSGTLLALAWQYGVFASLFSRTNSYVGVLQLPEQFSIVNKAGSNSARVFIIQQTWQMIMHHPWVGSGYGSFEGAFTRQVATLGDYTGESTLIHPHNELLYAWAEGGILAAIGLIMMVTGILAMLWRSKGLGWTGLALLLPIALHMNLEYPLYQSVPHGLVLVMLLNIVLPGRECTPQYTYAQKNKNKYKVYFVQLMTLSVCIVALFFMAGCLQTQNILTDIEQHEMYPLALDEKNVEESLWNPQSQVTRLEYDKHIAKLIRFNMTRDRHLLEQFEAWAAGFQQLHRDPNVMASRMRIAQYINPKQFYALCNEGRRLWSTDPRFQCRPLVQENIK